MSKLRHSQLYFVGLCVLLGVTACGQDGELDVIPIPPTEGDAQEVNDRPDADEDEPIPGDLNGDGELSQEEKNLLINEEEQPSSPEPTVDLGAPCLTVTGSELATFDPASGEVNSLGIDASVLGNVSSLGRVGDVVYGCNIPEFRLGQVDLRTGEGELLDLGCESAASFGGRLFLQPSFAVADDPSAFNQVRVYENPAQQLDDGGEPSSVLEFDGIQASRIMVHDGVLYAAWHSTDEIQRFDVNTQASLPSLQLDGYDTWVNGMAITSEGLLLNASWPEDRVAVVSAEDGQAVRDVAMSQMVDGLHCEPGS